MHYLHLKYINLGLFFYWYKDKFIERMAMNLGGLGLNINKVQYISLFVHNSTPDNIKLILLLNSFKRTIKKYYINLYLK